MLMLSPCVLVAKGGQVRLSRSDVEGDVAAGAGKLLLLVITGGIVEGLVSQGDEEVVLVKEKHFLVAGRVRFEKRELFEVVDIIGFMEEQIRGVKPKFVL